MWSEALLRPRTSSRSLSKGIGCAALTRSHPHTGAHTPRDTDASPRAVSPYSDFVVLNIKGGNKVFLERESLRSSSEREPLLLDPSWISGEKSGVSPLDYWDPGCVNRSIAS